MLRCAAHVLEVVVFARNSQAFLGRSGAVVVAADLAEKGALEWHHPRIHEQQSGIALGNEWSASDDTVIALLEEAQKDVSNLTRRKRHTGPLGFSVRCGWGGVRPSSDPIPSKEPP